MELTGVRERSALAIWGRRAWYMVGIALALTAIYLGSSLISALVLPLVVAAVVGALFAPLCQWFGKFMPRQLAALLVLLGLLAIAVGTIAITVRGVIEQASEIWRQVTVGLTALQAQASEWGLEIATLGDPQSGLQDVGNSLLSGIGAQLGSVFSGTAALALAVFVGLFLLYFILADWSFLVDWISRHLGVSQPMGAGIIGDATWAMRRYFLALTASNLVSSLIVGTSVWLMGLPLAFPIAVVTMVTSYIPFLGAIVSGSFAVLIALGSGGIADALIILVIVLAAQNGVQTIIQTFMTQGALKLHPILILGTTIAGGALFGLLGAALSTPIFASALKIMGRLRTGEEPPDHDAPDPDSPDFESPPEDSSDAAGVGPAPQGEPA